MPGVARPLMPPRPHHQAVAHDDPSAAGVPARLQHHRARQIAPVGRDGDVFGTKPEPAGVAVQNRAEHARPVHPGQAHPLDRPAGRDQSGHLTVRQEPVVGDRRIGGERVRQLARPPGSVISPRSGVGLRLCGGHVREGHLAPPKGSLIRGLSARRVGVLDRVSASAETGCCTGRLAFIPDTAAPLTVLRGRGWRAGTPARRRARRFPVLDPVSAGCSNTVL